MKRGAPLLLAVVLAGPAGAMPELRRGLNFDIWNEWLSVEQMLADPAFLRPYPGWRRILTAEQVALVAEQGFDFVRLPMDPAPLLALGPGAEQDRLIADIRAGAEIALAAGLSVVVDLHAFPRPDEVWGVEDVTGRLWPEHVALVGRVAAALDGLPADRVAFEPLNEPTVDCPAIFEGAAPVWPAMLAEMHAAARAGAPDLAIVLSGACWGGAAGLVALDPGVIADENVIWSFHSYEPFAFTHQGAVWTDAPLKHISGLAYPPSAVGTADAIFAAAEAAERMQAGDGWVDAAGIAATIAGYMATPDAEVGAEIAEVADWADRHGIPRSRLILGEFGALRAAHGRAMPAEWQRAFLADKVAAAEAAGIAWAVWNHAGDMGVAAESDPDRRLSPATCAALGLVPCSP